MTTTTTLQVHAIDPSRLAAMRQRGADEHGNAFVGYAALGWEPLRCCLRRAGAEEVIALIAYTPSTTASPWAETGPVYVHAEACPGYEPSAGLPAQLRSGPRILRTYRADGTLDYEHIAQVAEGVDCQAELERLLAIAEVAEVHVRPVLTQCFLYAVRAAPTVEE